VAKNAINGSKAWVLGKNITVLKINIAGMTGIAQMVYGASFIPFRAKFLP
jgi:hypothetical protein